MFGSAAFNLIVLLLVVSLVARQTPLLLLALALVLATGLAQLWDRHCLTGLEYRRRLGRRCAEFGETVELELEIANRKLLPLAWLEVEEEIPQALPPARGRSSPSHKDNRSLLHSLIALRPYERVRRRYPILCLRRGEHVFGPARLRTGDLFGLASRDMVADALDTLVVYPRVLPLTALGLPAHQPLGDLRTRSWLFQDPSRTAGVRDYRPEDTLRRIHWPASVRAQQLQARVYEPTTSHKLVLFLNLRSTSTAFWNVAYDPDALELAITTAASIASWGLAQRYQVGLFSNGLHRLGRTNVSVEPSSAPTQLEHILEALGRLQTVAAKPFETILADTARRLAFGSTVVAVSAVLTGPMVAALISLHRRGHPVTLVLTGRQEVAASLDGVIVRRVGPPEAWREASSLSLAGA